MESVSQNGLLKQEEFARFKERTVKLRFMQQISYGLGAAMVFGLFTALATKLAPLALGSAEIIAVGGAVIPAVAASVPAMIGLAAIATLGIGLIYLSAKFLSENTLLEQDFQAKKIGMATRMQQPLVEQTIEQTAVTKPTQFPTTVALNNAAQTPDTTITERSLQERVVPLAAKKELPANDASFAERAQNTNADERARA